MIIPVLFLIAIVSVNNGEQRPDSKLFKATKGNDC